MTNRRWSGISIGWNVLGLDKESFSAGCKKETGKTIAWKAVYTNN